MKTAIYFVSAAILGVTMLCSCDNSGILTSNEADSPHISLTVCAGNQKMIVKADVTGAGEDSYNENLINSIHYFFFANGSADQTAVVKGSASGISETESYTELIPISTNDLNHNLFDNDRKCSLFVIANAPESMNSLLNGNPTLAQLRTATVISDLSKMPQDNFAMVYDDQIAIGSRIDKNAIDVTAEMKRLACKFTIKADVKKTISVSDGDRTVTWTASTAPDALTVTIGNILGKTTPNGFDKSKTADNDYFDSTPVRLGYTGNTGTAPDVFQQYTAVDPIYSYPMNWVFTDQHEPYLLFDMTWDYNDGTNQHQEHRYYKLVLGQQSITANDWYIITAKLTALGNLLPRDPLDVFNGLNYSVMSWNNAFSSDEAPNTPANIKAARFLMVPQTDWKVNNETECVIPISTSHPCEIVNVKVSKKAFLNKSATDVVTLNKPYDIDLDATSIGMEFTENANWTELTFHHDLHNNLDDDLDYSPYTVNFRIQHKDDHTFYKDITITQYPAIWVDNQLNSEGETDASPAKKGYLYINGSNSGSGWQTVNGAKSGLTDSNTSRYMTIIHVNQFAPGEKYIIGDPRKLTTDNLGYTGFVKADALYPISEPKTQRKLTYYYPTNESPEYYNYVAPVLRVSSGHARYSKTSYGNIKYRCASYQEDGYPAGRWRLPTEAEAMLMCFMSMEGFIPSFFSPGGTYGFADGYIVAAEGTTPTKAYHGDQTTQRNVRCVYDEWYWSQVDEELGRKHGADLTETERKTFVWGDMPRDYTITSK